MTDGVRVGGRSQAIDALRAIAAAAVVLSHVGFQPALAPARAGTSVIPEPVEHVLRYGGYGVHLFLVISGFCIHLAVAKVGTSAHVSFYAFWKRRLLRLYPPYFVALLLTLAGLLAVFGSRATSVPEAFGYADGFALATDVLFLLLLLQNLNGASERIGNGPFWSLALEEQLYALYFPLLRIRQRFGWAHALVAVVVATVAWRLVGGAGLLGEHWRLLGPARWFEWTLGALAVEGHLGRITLPRWTRSPTIAVLCLVAGGWLDYGASHGPVRDIGNDLLLGLGFFILVNALCAWERAGGGNRLLDVLGRAGTWSYSLYLTHTLVMAGVKQLALRLGAPIWIVVALRAILPFAFAYGFFQMFERPFIERARHLASSVAPDRTASPPSAA